MAIIACNLFPTAHKYIGKVWKQTIHVMPSKPYGKRPGSRAQHPKTCLYMFAGQEQSVSTVYSSFCLGPYAHHGNSDQYIHRVSSINKLFFTPKWEFERNK